MANKRSIFEGNLVRTLLDDIQKKRSNWYYVLGGVNQEAKSLSGSEVNRLGAELSPAEQALVRSELVAFRKVNPGAVSRTVRRFDWRKASKENGIASFSGTQFETWRDDLQTDFIDYSSLPVDSASKNSYYNFKQPYYCGVMNDQTKTYDLFVCRGYGLGDPVIGSPNISSSSADGCRVSVIKPRKESNYIIGKDSSGDVESLTYYDPMKVYEINTGIEVGTYGVAPYTPTALDTSVVAARGDGYIWKFLGSVSYTKMKNYADGMHVPISLGLNNDILNGGSISAINVVSQGSGYTNDDATYIEIDPTIPYLSHPTNDISDPNVATVQNLGDFDVMGGFKPTSFSITRAGNNYIDLPDATPARIVITRSDGGPTTGSGAQLTPVFSGGKLVGITVDAPGAHYSATDKILVVTGGCKFAVVVSDSSSTTESGDEIGPGSILKVAIIDGGAGVITPPSLKVKYKSIPGLGSPSGLYGPTAVVKTIAARGQVQSTVIEDPGVGYPASKSTFLTINGDGSGARATPIIDNGRITSVIITDAGSGYSVAAVQAYTDVSNVTPAKFEVIVERGEFSLESSVQSFIEQSAIPGAISSVDYSGRRADVDRPPHTPASAHARFDFIAGSDYDPSQCEVVIIGDGDGAAAIVDGATIGIGGEVSFKSIKITSPGKGYTWARGYVKDLRNDAPPSHSVTPGSLIELDDPTNTAICRFRFNISPPDGHGANILNELASSGLCIRSSLSGDTTLTRINQDFGIVALMRNVTDGSGKTLTAQGANAMITFMVNDSSKFEIDETVYLDKTTNRPKLSFRVVAISNNLVDVIPLNRFYEQYPLTGELNSTRTPGNKALIAQVTKYSDVNRHTGDLVFYNILDDGGQITFSEFTGATFRTYIDLTSQYCYISPMSGSYDGSWYSGGTWL